MHADALWPMDRMLRWGREGGQNPIALMRDLYKSMRHYETDQLITTHFKGLLLGDTDLALRGSPAGLD